MAPNVRRAWWAAPAPVHHHAFLHALGLPAGDSSNDPFSAPTPASILAVAQSPPLVPEDGAAGTAELDKWGRTVAVVGALRAFAGDDWPEELADVADFDSWWRQGERVVVRLELAAGDAVVVVCLFVCFFNV